MKFIRDIIEQKKSGETAAVVQATPQPARKTSFGYGEGAAVAVSEAAQDEWPEPATKARPSSPQRTEAVNRLNGLLNEVDEPEHAENEDFSAQSLRSSLRSDPLAQEESIEDDDFETHLRGIEAEFDDQDADEATDDATSDSEDSEGMVFNVEDVMKPAPVATHEPAAPAPATQHDTQEQSVDLSRLDVPATSAGRGRAGRAKTRLIGFNSGIDSSDDPFKKEANTQTNSFTKFPVGWLVVTAGPGRGAAFALQDGVAQIGRGEGQTVRLDFGDNTISRENHAAIAYDPEQNAFFLGHGGKANLVRCNNMPVLSTQELSAGDVLRIGETTLLFMPLCGPDFKWADG